jgi:hypothetical protein
MARSLPPVGAGIIGRVTSPERDHWGQPAAARPASGSELCLACGLCCEGVLHTYVAVTLFDRPRLRQLGLRVQSFGGHAGFGLPCPLCKNHRCAVYPPRLHACAAYRCDLLSQYLDGQLTLEAAQSLAAGARQLLADPALPRGQPFERVRAAARAAEGRAALLTTPQSRAAHDALQLAVETLDVYLQRHFRK